MLEDEKSKKVSKKEKPVDERSEEEGVDEFEASGRLTKAEKKAAAEDDGGFADPALPNRQLTPNFELKEFHSKDGVAVPAIAEEGLTRLCADVLERLVSKFGDPTVNSGFRSKARNTAVGGAPRSYHRYDLRPGFAAADVKFTTGNSDQWFAEADRILGHAGGVGFYARFIHVDNRAVKWRGKGG